jgi:phosphoserine phosphatase RsbX
MELMVSGIEWGAAGRPCGGEWESGDGYLVKAAPTANSTVIAVVDGVGHGREAARAARTALAVVDAFAAAPPVELLFRCHEALRATRGVVMTVAWIDVYTRILQWMGIGNVATTLIRHDSSTPREHLITRGGLLGHQIPTVAVASTSLSKGDSLVFVTDGVRWDPRAGAFPAANPERAARRLVDEHANPGDDALALVVRLQDSDLIAGFPKTLDERDAAPSGRRRR